MKNLEERFDESFVQYIGEGVTMAVKEPEDKEKILIFIKEEIEKAREEVLEAVVNILKANITQKDDCCDERIEECLLVIESIK